MKTQIKTTTISTVDTDFSKTFSRLAIFVGKFATELVDTNSLRLLPTDTYDLAILRIKSKKTDIKKSYAAGNRISFLANKLEDGIYNYKLLLINKRSKSEPQKLVSQTGRFCVAAGMAKGITTH